MSGMKSLDQSRGNLPLAIFGKFIQNACHDE